MAGALDGVRVLDFGQYIAGPLAAMLLGDQGAEVIRVEPPGGPRFATTANAVWNRGKRAITLDLKTEAGREQARALAAGADVLIENFRPGVMERLGLGAETLTAANPRLVYCSMPGFAADDPRAGLAAWEGVVGAATGTYTTRLGGADAARPVYTAIPISSSYAAFTTAVSAAITLVARERSGLGQHIVVPLFDSTFAAIGSRGLRVHNAPPAAIGGAAWVRQYECGDGRWVQFHAANTRFIHRFLKAAGHEEWIAEGLSDRARLAADPELNAELLRRMLALFKTRPAQEWEDLVNAAGTPTAICRSSAEWMDHPHARGSEMIVEVDDPEQGRMLQPGLQARLYGTPGQVRPRPSVESDPEAAFTPRTGQAENALTRDLRAALDGVKVLDLCIILAGPTCGRTLAEFGADVIKIDDPHREGGIAFHMDVNRGKRSILLDLKTEEGKEIFWKLLDQADVVVQNYRDGVVQRLGLDYESVKARKPGIVYASLNAYGHVGPWRERPGWEQLAQATTGMQARYGGDGQPVLQPFPVNDYGTGLMGAYAVALALLHKQRTGEGQHVQTALAYTAVTLQSLYVHGDPGKPWTEARGQDALGDSPLHRLYQAADGWFFFAARESELPDLATVDGLSGLDAVPAGEREAFLEARFSAATVAEWTARLTAAGAGAHATVSVSDLMTDPWVQAHGLSITREHDSVGPVTTNGPAPRLSRTPVVPGDPASRPGADAASILAEIGMAGELGRLVEQGVIVTEGVRAR